MESQIASQQISAGKNDPAATDLDYYSKPENYTGSNLQSLQRFTRDKNKEAKKETEVKKRVVKDAKYKFFNRYKHLLSDAIFLEDLLDREREDESEESDNGEEGEDVGGGGATSSRGGTGGGSSSRDRDARQESRGAKSGEPLIVIQETGEPYSPTQSSPSSARNRKSRSNMDIDLKNKGSQYSYSGQGGLLDDRNMSPDSMRPKTPGGSRRNTSLMASQRQHVDKVSRELRMAEVKESFVRAVKCVKAICRLSASARGNAIRLRELSLRRRKTGADVGSMRTFMDIANDETNTEENMKNAGLSFDPTFFKAKKEISLTSETKHILTTPSEMRTPEQVQTAMFGLQTLRSYAEYPLHMQEKLAKVAWYEVVAPKRIIIRQGHFAENFYFILSGNAVVTILLKDPKTGASFVKTATVMKKGMSFGELALLHHSKRTATVTSQDTVQLLSIGREDFFDIFMASDGPDAMPDHIKFISNLEFMKDWPMQELVDNPQHCLLHFFKRNTTIVANSNASEWIYIVKSGSCQVLKKLKGVIPNSQFYSKTRMDDTEFTSAKIKAAIYAPMVDNGRRNSKKRSASDEQDGAVSTDGKQTADGNARSVKFSKDQYSQNPSTKPAHFSADKRRDSCFTKRKDYDPPRRCKPPRTNSADKKEPPSKPGPVFVQVSSLKPRDVFGLDTVQFDDDISRVHTAVSLVSGGAECIMLSKAFYVKHARERVKKYIRECVRPYPDEEVFQGNLQIKEDWVLYKKVILTDLTSHLLKVSNRYNS